jgi:type I restriction enzyme S subunit
MSFPKHLDYKESGCHWIGRVPLHWHLYRLKHVADIVGGGTPSREKLEYWNGEIPWVSPKDMKSECISSAEECITELGLKNSTTSLQDVGRVLMVIRSGILQHTLPVAVNAVPVALNQDMKSFSFDETKCLPEFFLRWVQGLNDDLLLAWANEGATVESINQTLLQNSILPLPDVAEQRAIASFLDVETSKIDGLVSEQRHLIELLKEKRQAVISHAVTKGLNPNAPMKPSGIQWLGDVPEHWEVWKLTHFTPIITCGVAATPEYVDEGVPFLSAQNVKRNKVLFENHKYVSAETHAELTKNRTPQRGDILLSRVGTIGESAVVDTDTEFSVFVSLTHIRVNQAICLNHYLVAIFDSAFFKTFANVTTAYGGGVGNLNVNDLRELRCALPSVEEQAGIVEYIEAARLKFDSLISEAQRAIELLQERRTALISAAVTGKIDVRGCAPKEAVA